MIGHREDRHTTMECLLYTLHFIHGESIASTEYSIRDEKNGQVDGENNSLGFSMIYKYKRRTNNQWAHHFLRTTRT